MTPIVSTEVITQSGSVMTQTVTTMPTSEAQTTKSKKSSTPGLIAGIVVACVVALGFIIAALLLWCRRLRRRRQGAADYDAMAQSSFHGSPARPMSVSTGSALMGGGLPRFNISGDGDVSPISPADRRGSQVYSFYLQQDPRLAPFDSTESRTSFNDAADYTRKLEVYIQPLNHNGTLCLHKPS